MSTSRIQPSCVWLAVLAILACLCTLAQAQPGGGGGKPGGGTSGPVCGTTSSSNYVKIHSKGSTRYVKTNGCPGYAWTATSHLANNATATNTTFRFPTAPVVNTNELVVGLTNPVLGPIGVWLNGAQLFSISDATGANALLLEGDTFDTCGGHPSPSGAYHYHVLAGDSKPKSHYRTRNKRFKICKQIFWKQTAGAHSPLVAFLADGIPLYGPLGDNGKLPRNLDTCNGHTDATHAFYHYHATSNYPFTVNCLRGCVSATHWRFGANVACSPATVQYDYSKLHNFKYSHNA